MSAGLDIDAPTDEVSISLRAHRPAAGDPSSLEQKLAIASILSASGLGAASDEPLRLGRLIVQSKIGGGGMGVVYRAWDPELQRLVAVKVLRGLSGAGGAGGGGAGDDHGERKLIAREARALARLSHPNVVAVYDIIEDAGELCIVMEHVAGCTLRTWLARHPDAPWREVLEWFVQAGHGVVAAHAAHIVHQDLKPENVLIGDDGRARVVDFGLAHGNVGVDTDASKRGLDVAGGTPHYMAPEVNAHAPATPSSDQFSFCVALREALAGKGAPDVVEAAAVRGSARDPAARHASFAALVAVLEHALDGGVENRPRKLLLERVERLWLRGVLDRSLEGGSAVDLALHAAPHLVEPPWRAWSGGDTNADADAHVGATAHQLKHALATSNGSLLLVGPPGSGKTTLLLLLCRELWRAATLHGDECPPVVLSLSTYEPETREGRSLSAHFARWIADELVAKYGLPRPAVGRWLDAAGIVLLLDGLDETDARLRERVVETLNAFRAEQPLSIVVTCRDSEYEALSRKLAFGAALAVQPLDDDGIATVLATRAGSRVPQLARDARAHAQLRNPLLLTLLAGSANDVARTAAVPAWGQAYERYVERALAKTSERERADIERQLAYLARAMRAHNTSDLWLERLHFGWLERRWERVAAYAMGVALVLLFGVGINVAQVPLTGNSLASALIFGIGVSVSSFAYTRGRIKPVESLRWSWRRMVRLLPITTVCATVVGLAEAMRMNFAANLVGAGITGAILAVSFALDAGDRAGKVRPNAGIHRSLAFATLTSFGFGVPAGLLFGLVIHPFIRRPLIAVPEGTGNHELMVGVSVGLFVFTALFLIYGGFTVLMHYVLRLWIAWRTPLSLDLSRTLDRAVELRLMRRIGGGYVFLHRTLLDHFAESQRHPR